MAIDPESDFLAPVLEVIRQRLGKSVSPATSWRWRQIGINGAKLECVRSGGRWMSTPAAFGEFLRNQTANVAALTSQRTDSAS